MRLSLIVFAASVVWWAMTTLAQQGEQNQQRRMVPVATAPPPMMIPPYGEPISLQLPRRMIAAAATEAKRLKVAPAFAIVDSTAHLVMFEKSDNSDYGNGELAIEMAKSSVEFRRPTKEFADAVAKNPGEGFLTGIVPFQRGWPIIMDGRLIGAIGIVGLRGGVSENGKTPGMLIDEAAMAAAN